MSKELVALGLLIFSAGQVTELKRSLIVLMYRGEKARLKCLLVWVLFDPVKQKGCL